MALRLVSHTLLTTQTASQIVGQRLGHAHRKHAGFFQRALCKRGDVSRREHQRVVQGLQLWMDQDEAFVIECEARALQPGGATGLRDPHGFVGIESAAIACVQTAGRDLHHLGLVVDLDVARLQHLDKALAHARVVRGQDRLARGQQHKLQIFRAAPQRLAFVAQTVLHGQQQLYPARATTHHRDRHAAPVHRPLASFVQQRQPALVELCNRLDRHHQRLRTFNLLHLGGRTDVDRQQVVSHDGSVLANHFLVFAVDAHHRIVVQACPGKGTQAAQIDVHLVKAVVARNVARQHAGVRRVNVGADHGDAHAGFGLHGKHAQHAHMAVAAADQHQVAQHGLI